MLTDALADGPAARLLHQPAIDLARLRGTRLCHGVLDLHLEENRRRLTDLTRGDEAKLLDLDTPQTIRDGDSLFVPEGAFTPDITTLSAVEAAEAIIVQVEGSDA